MATGIAGLNADLVLLQEALFATDKEWDTAGAIAAAAGLFVTRIPGRGKVRSAVGTRALCRSDLALLCRDVSPPVRTLVLPADALDPDRKAFRAQLNLGGLTIGVAGAHFTHLKGAQGSALRRGQAEAFACFTRPEAGEIVIVGGDLNAEPGSEALSPLETLTDRVLSVWDDSAGTFLGEYRTDGPHRRIDHLYVRRGPGAPQVTVKVSTALTEAINETGRLPSDHAALVADLDIHA